MDAFGKESHLCLQNQSFSVASSFKMHSVMVCLKVNNYINGEIIFHLKRILKKLSYYNKIIVKFRAKKYLSTILSCSKHPFEGHEMHVSLRSTQGTMHFNKEHTNIVHRISNSFRCEIIVAN